MPTSKDIPVLLTCVASFYGLMQLSFVSTLPTAVELGGAIVAAVEEDAVAQDANKAHLKSTQWNFGNFTKPSEFNDFVELKNVTAIERIDTVDEGRGKKHHKKHKMMKHIYPLIIGTVLAKTVLVPLILKMLTAISTSSFIMAKIALAASGLLALKWIFADSGRERTHFEVVNLQPKNRLSGLGYNTIDWSDMSWSDSNYVAVKTTPKQHLKYIPLKGGSSSSNALSNSYSNNKVTGLSSNGYKYNYDKHLDGKPFL